MIVLQYLLGFIAFVFILGLIVLVHEAGHFIFARRAGILCYEFAIGMGPVIWQKKKGETVYVDVGRRSGSQSFTGKNRN